MSLSVKKKSVPETRSADLKNGEIQFRYVAGHSTFVALRYIDVREDSSQDAPRWRVSVHDRETIALIDLERFHFLTDAQRSFRSAIKYLAAGNPPEDSASAWAMFRTQERLNSK